MFGPLGHFPVFGCVRVFAGCVRGLAVFAGAFTVVFAVFGPSCKYVCVQCSVFGVLLRSGEGGIRIVGGRLDESCSLEFRVYGLGFRVC